MHNTINFTSDNKNKNLIRLVGDVHSELAIRYDQIQIIETWHSQHPDVEEIYVSPDPKITAHRYKNKIVVNLHALASENLESILNEKCCENDINNIKLFQSKKYPTMKEAKAERATLSEKIDAILAWKNDHNKA